MTELKHHGVKGQKWGVRRNPNRPGGADGKWESEKIEDKRGKIAKRLDSMKRERQWHKVLKDLDTMTTKDINTVKSRIDLENSLKSLSKTKSATRKDKDDYLRREKMSNQELSRKVARLRAKESLRESVSKASKEQREFGIKVAQTASTLGLQYAKNRKLQPSDFLNAVKDPVIKTKQNAWDESINVLEPKVTNPKAKKALELAKDYKFKTKGKSKS